MMACNMHMYAVYMEITCIIHGNDKIGNYLCALCFVLSGASSKVK